jgi:hypothetical protein
MTNESPMTKRSRLVLGISFVISAWSFVIWAAAASSFASDFKVEQQPDRLIITHGNQPVAQYIWKHEKVLRPFFAHLCAPGGIQVTRNFPPVTGKDATDHDTMHPGLWLAFGDISGHDFWRNKAVVKHEQFLQTPSVNGGKLTFATENSFQSVQGKVICKQISRFSLSIRPEASLLVWEADFTSPDDDFVFGDQEEMGLGVRVATPISEKNGGTIRSSEGGKTAKATWGKPAKWCDYSGIINERNVGIAIFTDPNNFRPSWWHNRDYGLFVANPFGRKALTGGETSQVVVKKGETFRLRFGVLLHSSATNQPPDFARVHSDFLSR